MEVAKKEVKEKTELGIKDEAVKEEKTLKYSIIPKNEIHTEEEKLKNETRVETHLTRIKKW